MDYRRYVAKPDAADDSVLSDWRWLIGPKLRLWQVTKAGDALLVDPGNGSIHFLDVVSGKVVTVASNRSGFESALTHAESVERWLIPELVDGQAALGMSPGANECLSFKKPPILGGQKHSSNIEICDISVHFSIAGQLHQQIRKLPHGTKIGQVKIDEPSSRNMRPWWKFW